MRGAIADRHSGQSRNLGAFTASLKQRGQLEEQGYETGSPPLLIDFLQQGCLP